MKPKDIKKGYAELLETLSANKEAGSFGTNYYRCKSGHITKTTHKDRGTTPMFIACKCGDKATSAMYPEFPLLARFFDEKIWMRPTLEQLLKMPKGDYGDSIIDHVFLGGLVFEEDLTPPKPEPNESKLNIQGQYEVFLHRMKLVESQMPEIQKVQTKEAFFAGFSQCLVLMTSDLSKMEEMEAVNQIRKFLDEVKAYWDSKKKSALKGKR